jgi:hypothetical protein
LLYKEQQMKRVFQEIRPSFTVIQAIVLALVLTGTLSRAEEQVGTGETVTQKASEQFENGPLKTTSLGQGIFMFSGDGGDIIAIVDDASALLDRQRGRFAS